MNFCKDDRVYNIIIFLIIILQTDEIVMILLIYYPKIVVRKISYFNIIILCNLITLWFFLKKKTNFLQFYLKPRRYNRVFIYIIINNISAAVEIILRRLL